MSHRVTLIPGDGIGPELAEATRRVLDASGVDFEWETVDAGEDVIAQYGTPLPEHVLESIRRNKVAIKGPITTPVGEGFRSVNVTLRQVLGLYANLRPARSIKGLDDALRGRRPRHRPREHRGPVRRHRAHGRPRRRGEHQDHHPRGVRADRPVRLRVRRRQRPAQGHGRAQGQHHEAVGRPVPRESCRTVAAEYDGRIEFEDRIVDNMCMQLVQKPELYDVLVLPNLYGDIVSDLCAGPRRRARRRAGREHRDGGRGVRAGPRLGAQVRRPRQGQSDRDDPVRCPDAPSPRLPGRGHAPRRGRPRRHRRGRRRRPTTWEEPPARRPSRTRSSPD